MLLSSPEVKFYLASRHPLKEGGGEGEGGGGERESFYGLLGVVPLLSCCYLVVVEDVSWVGRLPGGGEEVFLVEQVGLVAVPPFGKLSADQVCLMLLFVIYYYYFLILFGYFKIYCFSYNFPLTGRNRI